VEQWRSQKFSMGDWKFWAEPPAAEGKESRAKLPALGDFLQFFNKNNAFQPK